MIGPATARTRPPRRTGSCPRRRSRSRARRRRRTCCAPPCSTTARTAPPPGRTCIRALSSRCCWASRRRPWTSPASGRWRAMTSSIRTRASPAPPTRRRRAPPSSSSSPAAARPSSTTISTAFSTRSSWARRASRPWTPIRRTRSGRTRGRTWRRCSASCAPIWSCCRSTRTCPPWSWAWPWTVPRRCRWRSAAAAPSRR